MALLVVAGGGNTDIATFVVVFVIVGKDGADVDVVVVLLDIATGVIVLVIVGEFGADFVLVHVTECYL